MKKAIRSADPAGVGTPDPAEPPRTGLRVARIYLYLIAGFSIAGFVVGLIAGETLLTLVAESKREIIEALSTDPPRAALLIFLNNALASLAALVPILGLFVVLVNAAVIGSVVSLSPLLALLLLPHGVFELSGFYYAVYLGGRMLGDLVDGKGWTALASALKSWLKVTLPLLAIAAVIEVFVSAKIAELLAGK